MHKHELYEKNWSKTEHSSVESYELAKTPSRDKYATLWPKFLIFSEKKKAWNRWHFLLFREFYTACLVNHSVSS